MSLPFFSLIIRFSIASDRRVSLQLQRVPAELSHTRTQNFSEVDPRVETWLLDHVQTLSINSIVIQASKYEILI